ncbi:MAG: SPOR domain-containing protein [Proteobacteria bacterium]|nr:SPOR domain-containing protein [Pseudomonadota bacterium]
MSDKPEDKKPEAPAQPAPAPAPAPAARAAVSEPAAPVKPAPAAETWAIELGPFLAEGEAERIERRLNQAGYQTATYRQRLDAGVYAVLIEPVPSLREAQALIATLREQGFPDAMLAGTNEPYAVRVGEPARLRLAVQLAERVREKGHQVRVSARAGEALQITIRHGNFLDREEAERRSRDLAQLGLPNQVVRIK